MSDSRVTYELSESIATITLDDGKVNVLAPVMLSEINAALDQAEADHAVVVLTGRPGLFSAGFDLKVLNAGGAEAVAMLRAGFELSFRLLSFPTPVVIACPGHAMAMGSFVLLSADYRIGASGAFNIRANEVAIGMTMPRAAVEIIRQRLTPAGFTRATLLAEAFTPESAVTVGFLDRVAAPESVLDEALALAAQLATLDMRAHSASKLRARHDTLAAIRVGIEADMVDLGERRS